jgi:hypothetical protein
MDPSIYRIRKSFLLPLGLVVVLSCVLLITALALQLPKAKVIILAAFLLPALVIFAESSLRRVRVTAQGIEVSKLLRRQQMAYADLTAIDTIQVRKRAFISLSSEQDFIILTNSYARFGELLRQLVERAPETAVSDETRQLANNPPRKCSDIFSAWLAVAVLALIIIVQLRNVF